MILIEFSLSTVDDCAGDKSFRYAENIAGEHEIESKSNSVYRIVCQTDHINTHTHTHIERHRERERAFECIFESNRVGPELLLPIAIHHIHRVKLKTSN